MKKCYVKNKRKELKMKFSVENDLWDLETLCNF